MKRIAILIDADNIFMGIKKIYNARLDYKKLVDMIKGERILIRAIAYVPVAVGVSSKKNLIKALKQEGIDVKELEVQIKGNRTARIGAEVPMTIDALLLMSKVDVIGIVTGNGNFYPLVKHLRETGLEVEVYGFGKSTSRYLKNFATRFIDLSNYIEKIIIKPEFKGTSPHTDQTEKFRYTAEKNPETSGDAPSSIQ